MSRPVCNDLAEIVGESVNITVRDGHNVVSIDHVIGSSAVTTVNWIGRRAPLHAMSAGKVFLAHMSPHELEIYLGRGLARYTERTIVDSKLLIEQLVAVRIDGYAYTFEEHELGLAAVGAPIRAQDGRVIAAINESTGTAFQAWPPRDLIGRRHFRAEWLSKTGLNEPW